jgi:hypothetical protein
MTLAAGLVWSARAASLREDGRRHGDVSTLPDVPMPRTTSLPLPRLERMASGPVELAQRDSVPATKLASGEQLSALLRGNATVPSLAEIERSKRRDVENAHEMAQRAMNKKTK